MRKWSWLLTAFLALPAFYACTLLPPPGQETPASLHVVSRLLEHGRAETGFSNLEAASVSDYRSFNLFLSALFFWAVALLAAVADPEGRSGWVHKAALAAAGLGALLALGTGLYCLACGSNFLDYEPFTRFFRPSRARPAGAGFLALGAALALGAGLLILYNALKRDKEAGFER